MAKLIPIFRASTGLNAAHDPARTKFDSRSGLTDLIVAVNVDIDDTGGIALIMVYERKTTVEAHSMFSKGGHCLFVSGGNLCKLNPDYSSKIIAPLIAPDSRMSYTQVGDWIFYLNGTERGRYTQSSETVNDWPAESYIGPETSRHFTEPPIGHLISQYKTRLYVAEENILYASEPFPNISLFDRMEFRLTFPGRVRMIAPTDDGVFISDDAGVYFLQGAAFNEFPFSKKSDAPVIERTCCEIKEKDTGLSNGIAKYLIWTAPDGIYLAGPGGFIMNLTHDKLNIPAGIRFGAAAVFNKKYICVLEP